LFKEEAKEDKYFLLSVGGDSAVKFSLAMSCTFCHRTKAVDYYHKSLKIFEEIGDKKGMAYCLNNIGLLYNNQGETQKGLEYFHKSLKLREEIGDNKGVASSLNNIGFAYENQGDISKGLEYYHKSLKVQEDISDKRGIANTLNNIGSIHLYMGNIGEAKEYTHKSMKLAEGLGFPENIKRAAGLLSKIHRKEGNYEQALEMYELYIQMRDSVNNEKTQKAAIRQQTKYEFEKAQLVKEQEEKEKQRIEAEVTSRRDNLQYSVILIALLVLFGGVLSLGFVKVSPRMAEGIIFFSFLILFEHQFQIKRLICLCRV